MVNFEYEAFHLSTPAISPPPPLSPGTLVDVTHFHPSDGVFSISDQWGRAQSMMGGAIPGLLVLGSVRKWTEQAMGSKLVSSTSPQPRHQLLTPGSCPL